MTVLNIRKAQREGARLVIGLAGVSGSGKTYTALQLAHGMTNGKPEKIGFIDTENRRGSLYADSLPSPFMIGDLMAPFSPRRYIDAINEFSSAGVEVLIIDSVTHEWEGIGGCIEIAENNRLGNMPNWAKAKQEHKRFIDTMLQSPMHIIACIRAREKDVPPNKAIGEKEFKSLGLQPIQEKNFMFELTASAMLHDMGKSQDILKCPSQLAHLFTGSGYISYDHGKALREWVDGAKQLDPKVEQFRGRLQAITEQGRKHVQECWDKVPAAIQKALGDQFLTQILASADEYDANRPVETAADKLNSLSSQTNPKEG